jgi:hypothetical protein
LQTESDDEGLRHETQERLQTRRRLDVSFDTRPHRHSDDGCLNDHINVLDGDEANNNNVGDDDDTTMLRRLNKRRTVQVIG